MLQGPHLRTPNPGFNPGFPPPYIYYIKGGVNPGLNPGVWCSEMWAQYSRMRVFFTVKFLTGMGYFGLAEILKLI
jgi:hypothetical protein